MESQASQADQVPRELTEYKEKQVALDQLERREMQETQAVMEAVDQL